jgi:hypothetical protein
MDYEFIIYGKLLILSKLNLNSLSLMQRFCILFWFCWLQIKLSFEQKLDFDVKIQKKVDKLIWLDL